MRDFESMKIEDEIKQKTFKSAHQKAFINVVYTSGWLQQQQASLFKPYGITLPQFNILRILRGQHPEPATVSLLIDRMLDKTSNASRIVDKLEAKGLVTRKQCPSDRRTVDVLITDKGLALLSEMEGMAGGEVTGIKNLTDEEALQLSNLLDKIRD
ncbi:MarR family winged helix-turn-helix transcriptional regulator [Pontibacter sp. H249]|uniref:MarR family winged helix-turn-helix transcriptional regulator n=1 Tax=Pontibacter sp. H249 TaxID=3133420 RepID=UPI0030C1EE48